MHIQFAELPVFDQERAKAFYTTNLGFGVAADAPMGDDGWRWIELSIPGAATHLHFIGRADDALSADPVLVFMDDDVPATVAALRDRGVEITSEPQPSPWSPGSIAAEFRDSEGNRIVLSSK